MTVTDADVQHVRRAFVEFNQRYEELRDGGLAAYHSEFYTPDSVIEHVDGFPVPGRFEGYLGYDEWFGYSYGDYRDVTWQITDVRPVGERVVALVRVSGRGTDDITLEVELGITYELRDGRIAYVRVYLGHERALEAAQASGQGNGAGSHSPFSSE